MDKAQLLDIDFLKANHTRIYYFGLGFIQVVLNQYERVHFYSDELAKIAVDEGFHNHRYNFTSIILKGEFLQGRYQLIPGDSHILSNVNCSKDKELTYGSEIPVGLKRIERSERDVAEVYYEGDIYDIMYNEFHKVASSGNTITYLKRSDYIMEFAQVIRQKDKELVCPFSISFTEDELWAKIEEIIKN